MHFFWAATRFSSRNSRLAQKDPTRQSMVENAPCVSNTGGEPPVPHNIRKHLRWANGLEPNCIESQETRQFRMLAKVFAERTRDILQCGHS